MRVVSRLLARRRRLIAAILAGLAVTCVVMSVRPPQGVAVLAAARDLGGGRLSASDVMVVRLPPDAVPDGAFRTASAVMGRVVSGPMRRGEPLTDARLLSQGLLAAQGPGMVATPVRIADPAAARLLSPGDLIDVFAAFEGEGPQAFAVTQEVRVMAHPSGEDDEGALLVLATTPAQAAQLAQAQAHGRLSVAIHPR
ncbi:Flp pilus assembly protein CpaB [Planotetraspora sp. A-T 1434]|uniref:Flp pilus assembly protein CpaB n=1 Tax=Planotetraspora sp. A-T 1434 TaxID=2979219 RepID=UPI0021C17412|nr:Flp pilus assembly protein CpaB [Planotetraspora sp. A-T 1434]MCT9931508.1 Flp pilus assembly protein CpaB [Planotetraspora sp. A-T 1434]